MQRTKGLVESAEMRPAEKTGIQQGLAGQLKELKGEELDINALLAAVVAAFEEATTLINSATGTEASFTRRKVLVTSTAAKRQTAARDGALTPLDSL